MLHPKEETEMRYGEADIDQGEAMVALACHVDTQEPHSIVVTACS